MSELAASWERTTQHLLQAKAALPSDVPAESLTAIDEYLAYNELGLALDVLADVAEQAGAAASCWRALLAAVDEMSLDEDDDLHAAAVGLVTAHNEKQR